MYDHWLKTQEIPVIVKSTALVVICSVIQKIGSWIYW